MRSLRNSIVGVPKGLRFGWNNYIQRPGDGTPRNVTLVPGHGIGPEITASVQKIFTATHCPINFETIHNFSFQNEKHRELLRRNQAILIGVISPFKGSKYSEISELFRCLDMYAHMTAAFSFKSVDCRHANCDIVIIRENTEGEYSGIEHEVYPGVTESLKIITKAASLRIAEYAFEFAYLSHRKKVTAAHKANIMKICDGLFLQACREIAQKYPMIKYEEMIIDNCTMQMVRNPQQFDVIVTTNLYGGILSNVSAGITGGVGMIPGVSVGKNFALFGQGCRHTGNDIAGLNQANPTALILSAIMMLRYLNLPRFADLISDGLRNSLRDAKVRPRDIGGTATTEEFTNEVIRNCSPDGAHLLK